MSIDEKAFREQQERLMAENAQLRDEVKRLRGPFTCKHDPQYVGGACAACHAEWVDRAERAELQLSEAVELLRQANDLYTGYGLICGPIKDFPKYEGNVHQGEWIGKVRAIVRASKMPKEVSPPDTCGNYRNSNGALSVFCSGLNKSPGVHSPECIFAVKRKDEGCTCPAVNGEIHTPVCPANKYTRR